MRRSEEYFTFLGVRALRGMLESGCGEIEGEDDGVADG